MNILDAEILSQEERLDKASARLTLARLNITPEEEDAEYSPEVHAAQNEVFKAMIVLDLLREEKKRQSSRRTSARHPQTDRGTNR